MKVLQIFFLADIFKYINSPFLSPSSFPSTSHFYIVFPCFSNLSFPLFFHLFDTEDMLTFSSFSSTLSLSFLFPLHVCFLLLIFFLYCWSFLFYLFFFPQGHNCFLCYHSDDLPDFSSCLFSWLISLVCILISGKPLVWCYGELQWSRLGRCSRASANWGFMAVWGTHCLQSNRESRALLFCALLSAACSVLKMVSPSP